MSEFVPTEQTGSLFIAAIGSSGAVSGLCPIGGVNFRVTVSFEQGDQHAPVSAIHAASAVVHAYLGEYAAKVEK